MLFAKNRPAAQSAAASGSFAHNGRSALYSSACSVFDVRAPRSRLIRICALLNLRNIFRVAFLLSCHIFDCYGLFGRPAAGLSVSLLIKCFSAATLISYIRPFRLSSTIFEIFEILQVHDLVCARLILTAKAILPLLYCLCKHFFKILYISLFSDVKAFAVYFGSYRPSLSVDS